MKKRLTIWYLLFVAISFSAEANDTVLVDINLDVSHVVGGVDSFDRQKYVTIHSSTTESDWKQPGMDKLMDYVFTDLDVYFGRDNGALSWPAKSLKEDPSKSGYGSITSIVQEANNYKIGYASNSIARKYDSRADVMMGGQYSFIWPTYGPGDNFKWAGPDAVGEYLGYFTNIAYRPEGDDDIANGVPMNRFVEIINEPLYHFVDDATTPEDEKATPQEIFEFHRDVAKTFHGINTTTALIGGYTEAFPEYDVNNFNEWDERMKLFMDIAGSEMGFYSLHFYDFNQRWEAPYHHVHYKGCRLEATLDMVENYSMNIESTVKPMVISEYGGRDLRKETLEAWSPERDWVFMKAMTPLMMQFMDRPNTIKKAIPFIVANYYWSLDPEYGDGTTYDWRLTRQVNEPESNTGDYVFTELIKFYELWADVNGKRVDSWSVDNDVLVDAYVNGNKAYVIVSNVSFEEKILKLNILGENSNTLSGVRVKHLHSIDEVPHLDTTDVSSLETFVLGEEASAIIEYTYASAISIDQTSNEAKYYGEKVKEAIVANSANSFSIDNVSLDTYQEAVLRISFGRDHNLSKSPIVSFNGDTLIYSADFSGDSIQPYRDGFFGTLEISVPSDLLLANNDIDITFPDAGGHIGAVTLRNYTFSREVNRSNAVTGIGIYPKSVDLGVGQERILTPIFTPSSASDKRIVWASDNASVTVSKKGVVTGVTNSGSANVTATTKDGGFIATVSVNVTSDSHVTVEVDTIIVTPTELEIIETKSLQLEYEVLPIDADDKVVVWSSKNGFASVDNNGLVLGVSEGQDIITATSTNGKVGTSSINVIKKEDGAVTFDDEDKYLTTDFEVGGTMNIGCDFFTTTGESATGSVEYILVITDDGGNLYKRYTSYDTGFEGKTSASSESTISIGRAEPSSELPTGQFYKIIINVGETGNKVLTNEVSPVNLVAASGISDNQLAFEVYPNPANNTINIESVGVVEDVKIFNTMGTLMLSQKMSGNEIDISSLPEGVYVLEVSGQNGRSVTKLVIQR